MSIQKTPLWRPFFMECALRALRRAHFEHQAFALGHTGVDPNVMNVGTGVEVAHETYVTSAIAAEFNSSKLPFGWTHGLDAERRYYVVHQEPAYKYEPRWTADLMCVRVNAAGEDMGRPHSIIEAKRARLWQRVLDTGVVREGATQEASVRKDAQRLCSELGARPRDRGHVLVWGIARSDHADLPAEFFGRVNAGIDDDNAKLKVDEARWMPLAWNGGDSRTGRVLPSVSSWLWVAIAELAISAARSSDPPSRDQE